MLYWIGRWIRGLWCALSTSVFHKIRVPLILYADQASRSASVPSPCKNRGTKHAGMVELVDSVDLGSTANACRFESCCPHQQKGSPSGGPFCWCGQDSNPSKCQMPVAFGGNQFKNWLQPYDFASQSQQSSPVAPLSIRLEPILMPNASDI